MNTSVNEKDKTLRFNRELDVKPFSGFIIIRLFEKYSYFDSDNLEDLAKQNQLTRLLSILETSKPQNIRRNVKSVSLKKLRELEENARQSEFPPLHSLSAYWRLDYRNFDGDLDKLVKKFQELHEVDLAYKEMSASDPWIAAGDDTFAARQGYLDAAPKGIDARWAWTQVEFPGAGVGFIDLEQGWIPTHQDLTAASPTLVFNDNWDDSGDHGTAVLGVVVGADNNRGVVGIAPSVSFVRMVSHFEAASGTALHIADAIVAAITHMSAGDVLLLEVQRDDLPTETDSVDFDAIRLAVGNGIVVVEAGGNGNNNLDNWLDTWTNAGGFDILDRGSANFTDSGAIMVGASRSRLPHKRWEGSNFGSRIDCYAWGENIVTSGYANRRPGSLGNNATASLKDDYTSTFGGTSGASAIIVGAALILQGMYKATMASVLSPLQMRSLLSDPATGTAQGGGVAGNIGVMPNLRSIIENTRT